MKKLIIFFIVTILALPSSFMAVMAGEPVTGPVFGDANGDGSVDMGDCAALGLYCARMPAVIITDNADLNGDGFADVTDLVMLLQFLVNGFWEEEDLTVPEEPVERDSTEVSTEGSTLSEPQVSESEGYIEATENVYIDAGEVYLRAVSAAGDAYDAASALARETFEAASRDKTGAEYNACLEAYRQAVNDARGVYNDALAAAQAAYDSGMGR